MRPFDDPAELTPDERLAEVAGIFAAGILRLHVRAALSPDSAEHPHPKILPESRQDCLEVSRETVLSGPHGLRVSETWRREATCC
jgi:hypothetical protein